MRTDHARGAHPLLRRQGRGVVAQRVGRAAGGRGEPPEVVLHRPLAADRAPGDHRAVGVGEGERVERRRRAPASPSAPIASARLPDRREPVEVEREPRPAVVREPLDVGARLGVPARARRAPTRASCDTPGPPASWRCARRRTRGRSRRRSAAPGSRAGARASSRTAPRGRRPVRRADARAPRRSARGAPPWSPWTVASAARHIGAYQRNVGSRSASASRSWRSSSASNAVQVARLPQVDGAPVAALQLVLRTVVGGGERDQLVRDADALGEPVRVPERDVARVERGEQRAGVAARARGGHGGLAQRAAAVAGGHVDELDRQPRQQPGAQRGRAARRAPRSPPPAARRARGRRR